MPLYKLTSQRLARKQKEERIAAHAEDSDASSVSELGAEDYVLSDEDGGCSASADSWGDAADGRPVERLGLGPGVGRRGIGVRRYR